MQISPLAEGMANFHVLIATASEDTSRLLLPLQQMPRTEGMAESGGLFRSKPTVVFHALDYQVVDMVIRSRHSERPFAVAVVDVQPGTETKAEQILNALYHAEPSLGMVVLLSDGATLSQPLLDLITHSPRLTFLQMPATIAQIYQSLKVLLALWQAGQRNATDAEGNALPVISGTQERAAAANAVEPPATMHLEVMGSLASGIAHEFNNVLTVIQNQMDMAMQQADGMPGLVSILTQAKETASNASVLSRKLLSFSPEEESVPQAVDFAAAVDEEVMLLNKTLGAHIQVEVNHENELPAVWAGASTISQLIINVALHARNSMVEGGVLQVSTTRVKLQTGDKHARLFPDAAHGDYVMLTVEDPNPKDILDPSDPGRVVVSLPSAVQRLADNRLAWMQHTLQAAGGALNVTLLPGMIRTYQLLFPQATQAPAPVQEEVLPKEGDLPARSMEAMATTVQPSTVLVVDDDDTICMIMSQVLATEKHRVLTAKSADEAWQQWCLNRSTIKLLITDINMPGGANGVALGHAIQEQDGSVPVIYTSGHRAGHQFADLEIGANYLPKPFGMNDLLMVANRALASHANYGLS